MKGNLKPDMPFWASDFMVREQAAGMKSKRQMKLALRWLQEKKHISVVCAPKAPSEELVFPPAQRRGKKKAIDREFLYKMHVTNAKPRQPPTEPQAVSVHAG